MTKYLTPPPRYFDTSIKITSVDFLMHKKSAIFQTDVYKSSNSSNRFVTGACGRTRTDTVSLPLDFESNASTNSTTQAWKYYIIQDINCHHKISVSSILSSSTYFELYKSTFLTFSFISKSISGSWSLEDNPK